MRRSIEFRELEGEDANPEAIFHDIWARKMGLYQAILKMEENGSAGENIQGPKWGC